MIVVGKQQMTLSGRVGMGTAWVAGGEIAQQAMRLVGGIILARLLNPADYGLVAMAAFVVGLIEVFARCGMTEALIQKKDVTDDDWSSIYWAGVGLGGLVGIMAWFLAPMAALFYRNPSVAPVLQAIAWLALVTSLGATQAAFLAKSMEFRTDCAGRMVRILGWSDTCNSHGLERVGSVEPCCQWSYFRCC